MRKIICALALASYVPVCFAAGKKSGRLIALNQREISDITPEVIQNRFFTKKLRAEVGASAGAVLNESYSQTIISGARIGLFLSEKVGVEYNFNRLKSSDSSDLLALRSQEVCIDKECKNIEPSFNRLNRVNQLQIVTSPIYGKINLFDSLILYSDLTMSAGFARVDTTQGEKWGFTPGIGQRFYFSRSFSFRIDVTDIYLKETLKYGNLEKSNWRHNWTALAGLSVFLNSGER
jgi:outer membrane beta-barrel protein